MTHHELIDVQIIKNNLRIVKAIVTYLYDFFSYDSRPKGSFGRSKLDGRTAEIKRLLALGASKGSIARIMGVQRGTLNHFVKSRGLVQEP